MLTPRVSSSSFQVSESPSWLTTQEQISPTRSPTVFSTRATGIRKRQRLDNYFEKKARAAYSLSPELERSLLLRTDQSFTDGDVEGREPPCKCGCTEILHKLTNVFETVGRHNAQTHVTFAKNNLNSKKTATAHTNYTGKLHYSS